MFAIYPQMFSFRTREQDLHTIMGEPVPEETFIL